METYYHSVKKGKIEEFINLSIAIKENSDYIISSKLVKTSHYTFNNGSSGVNHKTTSHYKFELYDKKGNKMIYKSNGWILHSFKDPFEYNCALKIVISDPKGKVMRFDNYKRGENINDNVVFFNRVADIVDLITWFEALSKFNNWECYMNRNQ